MTVRCKAIVASITAAILADSAFGQAVFDGSLGPADTLTGEMVITDVYGQRVGTNLFHSFSIFNIRAGESATFTTTFNGATDNVIARVTGGMESLIDGPLVNAIPGADFWLINPAGVVFGQGASLDVQGSFHASTADYLLLDDGGRFAADLNDASGTILTMGNPSTFGFLGPNPAPITITQADLVVPDGETLSLSAGSIELDRAGLVASSGRVSLASVGGPGEIGIQRNGFDVGDIETFGDITMSRSDIDTEGNAGGRVYIYGGQFVMTRSSEVNARTDDADGGVVRVEVDHLVMERGSRIDTMTMGSGDGADIHIDARDSILLDRGSVIGAGSSGGGDSGDITIRAGDSLTVDGFHPETGEATMIYAEAIRAGDAGDVDITAPRVNLTGGGKVTTVSRFLGSSGDITVRASDRLYAQGRRPEPDPNVIWSEYSGLFTMNVSNGDSGTIRVHAGDIELWDGAVFSAYAWNQTTQGSRGAAGLIDIIATGDVTLGGWDEIGQQSSSLEAWSYGSGDGGSISVTAENLFLLDGATIDVINTRGGDAAQVDVDVRDQFLIQGSSFERRSGIEASGRVDSDAGNVNIRARDLVIDYGFILVNMQITDGSAGVINIDTTDSLRMSNGSVIGSNSEETAVKSGDIFITTGLLEMTKSSFIGTNVFDNSPGAGSIFIDAQDLVIQDSAIDAEACSCSAGGTGDITINVAGTISISGYTGLEDGGVIEPAGIRNRTFGAGEGGTISINAGEIILFDGGGILSSSEARLIDFINEGLPGEVPGKAGSIFINTDSLTVGDNAIIGTEGVEAPGGFIEIYSRDFVYVEGGEISARAFGVTPEDAGGNVAISTDGYLILNDGVIQASANAGNGGNIRLAAPILIPSAYSRIDASSQTGIDGEVVLDSPNQAVNSVALLEAPVFDLSDLVQDPCEVEVLEDRSSLTIEGRGGLPPAPDEYQSSPQPNASGEYRPSSAWLRPGQHGAPGDSLTCQAGP